MENSDHDSDQISEDLRSTPENSDHSEDSDRIEPEEGEAIWCYMCGRMSPVGPVYIDKAKGEYFCFDCTYAILQ